MIQIDNNPNLNNLNTWVNFEWTSVHQVSMSRNTTPDTVWNSLTIQAWWATVWASNKNGWAITIQWGIATWTWSSNIAFNVYRPTWSGTSDGTNTWLWLFFAWSSSVNDIRLVIWNQSTNDTFIGINMNGLAWQVVYMKRNTTANTAWNNLIIQSGWATSWATDKNGWTLLLVSWIATWTWSSKIEFHTTPAQWSTNTTDNSPTVKMTLLGNGNLGIWQASPTATLHLKAWTATAWTAPIKLTSWTNLTAVEDGVFEYNGTNLFFSVGAVRKTVTLV